MDSKETDKRAPAPSNKAHVAAIKPQFVFNFSQHALTGPDGQTIKLRSQSLKVFLLLLENANQVVSKNEILASVWKGITVTDDSVTQCIGDIRRALGKEHRSLLQTIPKIGYRLSLCADENSQPTIAPLGYQEKPDEELLPSGSLSKNRAANFIFKTQAYLNEKRSAALLITCALATVLVVIGYSTGWLNSQKTTISPPLNGPTLAVLPFENVGESSQSDLFSDGITEDIITLLSRFSELGLISWRAVSSHSTEESSPEAIAIKFGVKYLISGTVRHTDKRLRVAVQLTNTHDGRLLWSNRYDEKLEDLFLVQDKIAEQIVATLAVKLTKIETEYVRTTPTENMAAYELSLLGRVEYLKRTKEGNKAARAYFKKALELDPRYFDAYIRLGETHLEEAIFGWTEWPQRSIKKALSLGRSAMEIAGPNARILGLLARINIRLGEYSKAQTYLERAFLLNPNDPMLHEIQGLLHVWNGKAKKAIAHLEYVHRYDPQATQASSALCVAYYVAGRPADAVAIIERTIETAPNALFDHIILTAALVETGDLDAARSAAKVVHRRHPFLTAAGVSKTEFFSSDEVKNRLIESLRQAGIK